jgi:hypothetical protein
MPNLRSRSAVAELERVGRRPEFSAMNDDDRYSPAESRSRASFVLLRLLSFAVVAIGGWWIHVAVLPLPIETTPGLVARYVYFLLWLGGLIHLLGRAIFGPSTQLWHGFIYFLLGGFLGFFGGLCFAGLLGCLVGGFTGMTIGPFLFFARHGVKP